MTTPMKLRSVMISLFVAFVLGVAGTAHAGMGQGSASAGQDNHVQDAQATTMAQATWDDDDEDDDPWSDEGDDAGW